MSVSIKMKDELQAFRLAGDFDDVVQELNESSRAGMEFVVAQKVDGKRRALSMRNINTIDEEDVDDAYIG